MRGERTLSRYGAGMMVLALGLGGEVTAGAHAVPSSRAGGARVCAPTAGAAVPLSEKSETARAQQVAALSPLEVQGGPSARQAAACPLFGPEQCAAPAGVDEQRVMGAYALKKARYFRVQLEGVPKWAQFEQRRRGFRIHLFGARAKGKAGRIAHMHPRIRYSAVYDAIDCLGRGRCVRFEVKFEQGQRPGYRVYWMGEFLWLELGDLSD